MAIGKRIRAERGIKGLTQKELATLTGIAEITIRGYENEKFKPKIEQIKKIADALEINVDYLLGSTLDGQTLKPSALTDKQKKLTPVYTLLGMSEEEWNDYKYMLDYLDFLGYDFAELEGVPYNIFVLNKDDEEIVFTPQQFKEFEKNLKKTIEFEMFKQKQNMKVSKLGTERGAKSNEKVENWLLERRKIVLSHYNDGHSISKISKILGISKMAIYEDLAAQEVDATTLDNLEEVINCATQD